MVALQAIYAQPLGFEPGSRYAYSNTGYTILAVIVQAVSGRPFVRCHNARFGATEFNPGHGPGGRFEAVADARG